LTAAESRARKKRARTDVVAKLLETEQRAKLIELQLKYFSERAALYEMGKTKEEVDRLHGPFNPPSEEPLSTSERVENCCDAVDKAEGVQKERCIDVEHRGEEGEHRNEEEQHEEESDEECGDDDFSQNEQA
jgi:hypothetical protein